MQSSIKTLLLTLIISSCSVAPLSTTTTARPLGKDNNQLTANGMAPGIQYTRGITDKLDLNIGVEDQDGIVFNAFAKYALINNENNGYSFAPLFGIGYGEDIGKSKSVFLGGIVSYRSNNNWEPFLNARINYVHWTFSQLSIDDKDFLITIPSVDDSFYYGQADIGVNYLIKQYTFSVGARTFFFPNSIEFLPIFDIGYKF